MTSANRKLPILAGTMPAMTVLTAWCGPAAAHPGDHSHVDVITHLLTEPDHLAMIGLALAVAVAGWRWWRARGRRSTATRRDSGRNS